MKKRYNLIISILVFFVLSMFFILSRSYIFNKYEEMPYTNFMVQLENNEIASVKYDESSESFYYTTKDGKNYACENPNTENFKENLLLNGVSDIHKPAYAYIGKVLMCILIAFLFYTLAKLLSNKQQKTFIEAQTPDITFDDVVGMDELKEEFLNLKNLLENNNLKKMSVRLPKGILLQGIPGTGKTYLAKAFAGETKRPFFSVNASQFGNIYSGLGAEQIDNLFKSAKEVAPSVIFIDEIDAIGSSRKDSLYSDSDKDHTKTLNALLASMDGFERQDDVLVIAATNHPEVLDEALTRSGRFDKKFIVGAPDAKDRKALIDYYLNGKDVSEDITSEWLVSETPGLVPADIESIINEAGLIALSQNETKIKKCMIETAMTQIEIKGKEKNNYRINSNTKEIIAYHEAGHAVVSSILCGNDVSKVSIIPTTSGVGGYTKSRTKDIDLLSSKDIKNQLMLLYAGRESEKIRFGKDQISLGCIDDIQKATMEW